MTDIIILATVAVILALAVGYIVKAKKKGTKCIGCPSGGNCKECSGQDSCSTHH